MLYIWYRMLKCCQNIHFIIFDIEKNHLRVMIFKKISNMNLFNIRDTFSTSPKKRVKYRSHDINIFLFNAFYDTCMKIRIWILEYM